MKSFFRILVVCIFATAALNGAGAAGNNYQKAKRAYDKSDYAAAIKLLLPMARGGDPKAQNLLGLTYYLADGRTGVNSDRTKAQFWYEKAVKQDYLPAIRGLGFLLAGTAKNSKRGFLLLKTAAERGDAEAQWGMGFYLSSSNWGLSADRAAARKWLLKSIEQKYVNAALQLMKWHLVEKDYTEAYKWNLIVQYLWKLKSTPLKPDVREKMTESQIAESQRRAKAWLIAHGEKP